MRLLIQRVSSASVKIDNSTKASIGRGCLVFIGIETEDKEADVDYCVSKLTQMRIFGDESGKMNLSIQDIGGELLLISQFTLHAVTRKGNRPSFIRAAKPEWAIPLYETFIQQCKSPCGEPYRERKKWFPANSQAL